MLSSKCDVLGLNRNTRHSPCNSNLLNNKNIGLALDYQIKILYNVAVQQVLQKTISAGTYYADTNEKSRKSDSSLEREHAVLNSCWAQPIESDGNRHNHSVEVQWN